MSEATPQWRFSDPPELGVFVAKDVFERGQAIVYVSHDNDGDWSFSGGMAWHVDDVALFHLDWVVRHHPYVSELADLPRGWAAARPAANSPWSRFVEAQDDDEDARKECEQQPSETLPIDKDRSERQNETES